MPTLSRIHFFRLTLAAAIMVAAGSVMVDRLRTAEKSALERIRLEAYESNRRVHLVFEAARTVLDSIGEYVDITAEGTIVISWRLDAFLDRATGGTSVVRGAIVQDLTGRVVAAGAPRTGIGLLLAELDYFQAEMKPDALPYEVGAPFDSRILDATMIPIAKSIRDSFGRTIAVASVGIPVTEIQAALAPSIGTPDARSRLWRSDGLLLASSRDDNVKVGVFYPNLPLFDEKRIGPGGTFVALSPLTNETRLSAWRDSFVYPVFVSTGANRAAMLARDRAEAALIAGSTLGLLGLLLLTGMLVDRERRQTAAALVQKEHALQVKNMFLANMSHEFRTPLNAISGYSQMLELGLYGSLGDKQKTAVGSMALAANHLANLTETLLDLSRIEAGKLPVDRKPESVAEIVGEAVALVAPQASLKNIQLRTNFTRANLAILGDKLRSRQILSNLLSNAIRSGRDGGTVEVRIASVADDKVRVTILDDGPGFGTAPIEQFFEPFSERDAKIATKGGIGLGLPLARGLARAQGGEVTLSNRPEGGAAAMLELPKAA